MEGHNLFSIGYRSTNAQQARDIVAGLVSIFLEKATGSSRADMANAQKFIAQQIAAYESQLRAAEQRRVDFRRKYADILPMEGSGGESRLDGARAAVQEFRDQKINERGRGNGVQFTQVLSRVAPRSRPDVQVGRQRRMDTVKINVTRIESTPTWLNGLRGAKQLQGTC